STAVWVGMIALMGVDAQTGVFMLLYLDLAYENARGLGKLRSLGDLRNAILEGAAMRIRPKFMTVTTMFVGLLPIFWSTRPGSDLMKRIAAPMAGGMVSSFLMELLIYPVLYMIWRQRGIAGGERPVRAESFVTEHGNFASFLSQGGYRVDAGGANGWNKTSHGGDK